jgi:uncharacterized protein
LKDQLTLLLKLQELDLETDQVREARREIDLKLGEFVQVLDSLRSDLDEQREELEATEDLYAEKLHEQAEMDDRLKKSKLRLSKVTNTKEYAAIELEIENSKRQLTQLDEELAQLKEAIEASREAIAGKQARIDGLTEQVALEEQEAESHVRDLEQRLVSLKKNREQLQNEVTKSLSRRYDFIRSRRNGMAVVAARNGCCQGCFMQLPPQLYIEVQRSQALKVCPSCQRILYWEEHVSRGATKAEAEPDEVVSAR